MSRAAFFLVAMFAAAPVSAQTNELTRPTVMFSAAAAADWITTYRTLSAADCRETFCVSARERNPILRPLENPARIVAAGAAMDVAGVLIARKFGKRHPKIVKVVLYSASAYRGFLAARNAVSLHRNQQRVDALNAIYGPNR